MGALLGDFLRITMSSFMFDQTILNVLYYRVTSIAGFTDDGYEACLDDFVDNILEPVQLATSTDFRFDSLYLQNISNGIDIATRNIGLDGSIGAGSLPSFVNYTFRLQRETVATRNGYKRFAGVPESYVTGNTYTGPGGLIDTIEQGLALDLLSGLVSIAEPVIMKRPLPTIVPSSHPYSSIGGSDFRGIGTQNTRKGGGWT